MFIKKSFVDEIACSMEQNLIDGAIEKQAESETKMVKAAEYLHAAAEICDEYGLSLQAEAITTVLESLAAKKNKKKTKTKSKTKAVKKPSKAPTSEKMVDNLKQKGWMFDENGAQDHNCVDDDCVKCSDMSMASDEDFGWWHLYNKDFGDATYDFKGDRASAERSVQRRNHFVYPGWDLKGPFKSIEDLEKEFYPHFFKKDTLMADDHEQELYSMLDDFKKHIDKDDNDFEDELDFEGFEDRL